jgi:hypothetical protein
LPKPQIGLQGGTQHVMSAIRTSHSPVPIVQHGDPEHRRNLRGIAVFGGGLATILIVCSALVLFFFDPLHTRPSTVARLFTIALVEGNVEEASSLSSPGLTSKIRQWASQRAGIRCPASSDADDVPGFSACSSHDPPMEAKCSLDIYCWPLDYEFHIDAIRLARHGISWQVFDWKAICESTTHECQ